MFDSRRIADLSDKELEGLHGNAIRLAQSGTAAQRAEAERLLPVIGREVERRARARASLERRKAAEARESAAGKSSARKAADARPKIGGDPGIRIPGRTDSED